MFETGFLGTSAPLYMDIVTLYFAILPFLLAIAIRFAIKGQYEAHYKMQLWTFVTTLLIVVVFEVGVRISGGFLSFMEASNADYSLMVAFLIFHVFVAIVSVVVWSALIYGAVRRYRLEDQPQLPSHKKIGKWVFAGVSATSIMGLMIYYFLFVF